MYLPQQIITYVKGILYSFTEINCINISKLFENLAHDTVTRCLYRDEDWDNLYLLFITKLFPLIGGYLILDEVIINKQYAEKIEGLSYVMSPILKRIVQGYCLIVLCWKKDDICIPIGFRIWDPDGGKKRTELAMELVIYAKERLGLNPEAILFDSYYASEKMLNLVKNLSWIYCTQIKRNRFLNGKRVGDITFYPYWTRPGELKGGIKVVVARHGRKYFCTNDLSLDHQAIRTLYKKRWPIEEVFRFSKQNLGLSQCRSRSKQAQKAHFTLCFMAYTVLQKESILRGMTDYKIKSELSFQRAKFNLLALRQALF